MENIEEHLCGVCRERIATHHACRGGEYTDHFCGVCYHARASSEELASMDRMSDAIRNGKCQHCGGQATGGSSYGGGGVIPLSLYLFCDDCARDSTEFSVQSGYKEFLAEGLEAMQKALDSGDDNALDAVTEARKEKEREFEMRKQAYLQQKIRERHGRK